MVHKFSWDAMEQLALGLDVEEVDVEAGALSVVEIQERSEQARRVLETRDWGVDDKGNSQAPPWILDYIRLEALFPSWRIACYVAWEASPKIERWPSTLEELATRVLGLTSARQIYVWRKKFPHIQDAISMLQAAPLWESRAEDFRILNEASKKAEDDYKFFPYLKMKLEMRGDYQPRTRLDHGVAVDDDDASAVPDSELRRYAGWDQLESGDGDGDNN